MKGYQVKITLKNTSPLIWRRVQIPAFFTFELFHDTIQVLFGWQDYHLYDFRITTNNITIVQSADSDSFPGDADEVISCDHEISHYLKTGSTVIYTYDYGDMWEHVIEIEKEINMKENYPKLLAWKLDNLAENCGSQQEYNKTQAIINTPDSPKQVEAKEWMNQQHIPFVKDEVEQRLRTINDYAYDEPVLSSKVSKALSDAVTKLKDKLYNYVIEDLSIFALDTAKKRKIFAVNDQELSINIQIYDSEIDFLRGVENVSSSMMYNVYANAYSIILFDEPVFDDSHWTSEDACCFVKKMRTGYLPMDVSDEEAQSIIQDIEHVLQMLALHNNKKLIPMEYGKLMLGTWGKRDALKVSYPPIKFIEKMPTLRFTPEQCSFLEKEKVYDKNVNIDLLTQPSESYYINYEMDVFLVMESDNITSSQILKRNQLQSFESMTQAIWDIVYDFMKSNGRMRSVTVNNENMHLIMDGICTDLQIPIISKDFITEIQLHLEESSIVEEDLEMLEELSHMDDQEFTSFMSHLDKEGLENFDHLMQDLLEMVGEEEDSDEELPSPTKQFDA